MEKCWEILIYWLESIFHIIVIILQNCLRSKNLWMQVYISIHISKMYQTTSPLDFVQSNEKSKNYFNSSPPPQKSWLKGVEGKETRLERTRAEIKLPWNRSARFPFWRAPLDRRNHHRGELSNDSIPRRIIRGNRAEIISPIEFFIGSIVRANCSRMARRPFKGWFASKPVDPSFTSWNCISHGTLAASFFDDRSPLSLLWTSVKSSLREISMLFIPMPAFLEKWRSWIEQKERERKREREKESWQEFQPIFGLCNEIWECQKDIVPV